MVGFTNDPESLHINEGDGGTLTVGFLKPPADVGEMASVSFPIDNSQNTGMLHICILMFFCIQLFLRLLLCRALVSMNECDNVGIIMC